MCKKAGIRSFSFYNRVSNSGYRHWKMYINGIEVGDSSLYYPATGGTGNNTVKTTGTVQVKNAVEDITGSITVLLKLYDHDAAYPNGNAQGTFRMDDFILNGYINDDGGSTANGYQYANRGGYRYGFQSQEKDNEIYGEGNAVSFKFRVEDTRLGRFFSVDPLSKKYSFYSPYSFSGNRVIDAIELEGLEPYILFKTEQDAALNFGNQFNGKSIKLGVEYAANIYRKVAADGNTYFYYDQPNKGDAASSRSSFGIVEWFKGGRRTATIHAHGEYLPQYDNNEFSPTDKENAESRGGKSYVTTPNGSLKVYDPKTNEPKDKGAIVNENLPSDPKDPDRKNTVAPVENPAPVKTTPIIPKKYPLKADPITPANGGIM